MIIEKTILQDAFIITPDVFGDNRGYFFESFSKNKYDYIFDGEFIQDNQSLSTKKGVIRGLHCQSGQFSQTKLVRVVEGAVDDVIVDVRKGSPSYLKWIRVRLSSDNQKQLLIPKGFLHAFVTITDNVIFCYKVDEYYNKASERGVLYNDPMFGIDWGVDNPILSDKDKTNPLFSNTDIDFVYHERAVK
ncbi:MAG: dTDP-4-dehydrorhamnose 3,5-epimerase [Bacilli bacterium]|jgi:dTDP-4-dehydrorhamnose 3,5-epimerase|nr:dTDP-4-dehydrorhamnose 3,5-epimerase [Bacilli bacterium]